MADAGNPDLLLGRAQSHQQHVGATGIDHPKHCVDFRGVIHEVHRRPVRAHHEFARRLAVHGLGSPGCHARTRAQQKDACAGIRRMPRTERRHDVRSGKAIEHSTALRAQRESHIVAVDRDDVGRSIGRDEVRVVLQVVEMIGIDGEHDTAGRVQAMQQFVHREVVCPDIEQRLSSWWMGLGTSHGERFWIQGRSRNAQSTITAALVFM